MLALDSILACVGWYLSLWYLHDAHFYNWRNARGAQRCKPSRWIVSGRIIAVFAMWGSQRIICWVRGCAMVACGYYVAVVAGECGYVNTIAWTFSLLCCASSWLCRFTSDSGAVRCWVEADSLVLLSCLSKIDHTSRQWEGQDTESNGRALIPVRCIVRQCVRDVMWIRGALNASSTLQTVAAAPRIWQDTRELCFLPPVFTRTICVVILQMYRVQLICYFI